MATPGRPVRPDPTMPSAPLRRLDGDVILAVVVCLVVGVLMFAIMFFPSGSPPDRREVRRFGDLQCVYNVPEDKVEACAP